MTPCMLLTLLKLGHEHTQTKVNESFVQAQTLNPTDGDRPCKCNRVLVAQKVMPAMSAFGTVAVTEGQRDLRKGLAGRLSLLRAAAEP